MTAIKKTAIKKYSATLAPALINAIAISVW
jgi:hypothetical protein